jgi:hypothetical protein
MSERILNAETRRRGDTCERSADSHVCERIISESKHADVPVRAPLGASPRLCVSALTPVFVALLVAFSSFAADEIGKIPLPK